MSEPIPERRRRGRPRRRHHRCRPRRPHRRVHAHQARASPRPCSRPTPSSAGSAAPRVRDGWRFDIGGHRFFTKVKPVDDLWFEILGPDDFLRRPRLSRIYYRGKFYDYPISADERAEEPRPDRGGALRGSRTCGCGSSRRRTRPRSRASSPRRFGWRLYSHFFKTQSEKVWGVPVHGDPGRLGRAAHQGPVAVRARCGRRSSPSGRAGAATSRSRSRA